MLFLRVCSAFFLLATFIPLIKWEYWWIRIFDYPRLQKLIIILILFGAWFFLGSYEHWEKYAWLGSLGFAVAFLTHKVVPFTPLGSKMIDSAPFQQENGIHLLVANVYQYNQNYNAALNLIQKEDPDLVFLVETDKNWETGLAQLEDQFESSIKIPKDNTYGLLLYTHLKIVRQEINYLIDEEIPSLELDIELRNGKLITIYAIHPTPPVPGENTESTERDAEILMVGKKSKENPLPSLVIGDLNDVAWSYTTQLFLKISEMADPRRGRGLFSTFHAKVPLFRWPLDHIFLSKHFGLGDLKVQSSIGSDHFPISLKAVLTAENTTETMEANGEEKKEAHQKISDGLESD